jgi:hypothetical protein
MGNREGHTDKLSARIQKAGGVAERLKAAVLKAEIAISLSDTNYN